MDAILSKLTEIEDAANRILGRTAEQKKMMSEQAEERIARFDRELEEKQNQYIEEETETLQRLREEKLLSLQTSTQEQLDRMDAKYREHHTEMAQEILRRILEA